MSKKTIKLLSLVMAIAMVASVAAGCKKEEEAGYSYYSYIEGGDEIVEVQEETSGNKTTDKKDTTTASNSDTSSVATLPDAGKMSKKEYLAAIPNSVKGKDIKIMLWWEVQENDKKMFEEWEKATGAKVKVDRVANSDDYYNKLSARIASGSSPNVAAFIVKDFVQVMANNYFQSVDLGGVNLNDSGLDLENMNNFKKGDKYYAISVKGSQQTHYYVVQFNKKMFADKGMKNPYQLWKEGNWNWDTFTDAAQKLTNASNGVYGFESWSSWYWSVSAGGDFIKRDGDSYKLSFDENLFKGYEKYHSLLNDLKVTPESVPSSANDFHQGKYAMWIDASYKLQKANNPEENAGSLYGVAPMPNPAGGETLAVTGGQGWGFPQKAKNLEASAWFLRFWLDENYSDVKNLINDECYEVINWMSAQKKSVCLAEGLYDYGGEHSFAGLQGTIANCSKGELRSTIEATKSQFESNLKKVNGIYD